MIQFLGRWLDPNHVLTISKPYLVDGIEVCSNHIVVHIQFMFMNSSVRFIKSVKNRIPFPEQGSAYAKMTDNERWHYMKKYHDAVDIDNKLQAAEFAESEEYKSFLDAVEKAKNSKPSPEMPELFESKEPKV